MGDGFRNLRAAIERMSGYGPQFLGPERAWVRRLRRRLGRRYA